MAEAEDATAGQEPKGSGSSRGWRSRRDLLSPGCAHWTTRAAFQEVHSRFMPLPGEDAGEGVINASRSCIRHSQE